MRLWDRGALTQCFLQLSYSRAVIRHSGRLRISFPPESGRALIPHLTGDPSRVTAVLIPPGSGFYPPSHQVSAGPLALRKSAFHRRRVSCRAGSRARGSGLWAQRVTTYSTLQRVKIRNWRDTCNTIHCTAILSVVFRFMLAVLTVSGGVGASKVLSPPIVEGAQPLLVRERTWGAAGQSDGGNDKPSPK